MASGTLPSLLRPLWVRPWLLRVLSMVFIVVIGWAAITTDVVPTLWVVPVMVVASNVSECLLWAHLAREHPYLEGRSYGSRSWLLFWRLNGAVGVAPGGRHGVPGTPARG
ncbi:hypothetical protein ACH436_14200 [Isoptericola sp. NPDC019693]|uniref:hypothetical protein n=1 Tax=Isoptericola sp. NPDC019693 TaxID=3364009 RepID=UPI00379F49EE